jgi:DNA repair photolyase
VLVKANAIELLRRELARKRIKGLIGAGSMNDPYMPLERTVRLTGRALDDTPENVFEIITRAKDAGATHVVAAFGMTLRDRQRATYYDQLDRRFPGLRQRYERAFGERYHASASGAARLEKLYVELTDHLGLQRTVAPYRSAEVEQLALF